MRKSTQFFAHSFSNLENAGFDPAEYSKLKFGSDSAAKKLGYELADAFFKTYSDSLIYKDIVVIPSPYNYVENAATVMSKHFVNRLNHHITSYGGKCVEWDIIKRKVSYINDYGFLDKETRKKLIDNDTFFINKEFWGNKTIIFVDDVNITGTHEEKLVEILDKNNVQNDTYFLYYAKYENGTVGANIEAALNFSYVTSIDKFVDMTKEQNHHIIVRPIKYLMSQQLEQFKIAISQMPDKYISELYYGCLAEGYDKIQSYNDNFKFLKKYFVSENFVQ